VKIGDEVKAVWSDGLILSGTYIKTERGYVILKSSEGNQIVCSPNSVIFEVLNPTARKS